MTNQETPIGGIRLPSGQVSNGERPLRTLRLRNAYMAKSFDLNGKRVLDIGCAEGLHSLYMAENAFEVVGIDHRSSVISIANATKEALGINNAKFILGDVRDKAIFDQLGRFDLVVAWGLLHRIANPFKFFSLVSHLGDAVSLEWRTLLIPFGKHLSIAYHSVDSRIDSMNIGECQNDRAIKIESAAGFWDCTPGAVYTIARREGFSKMEILGYGENFMSGFKAGAIAYAKFIAKKVLRRQLISQFPLSRVHVVLKNDDSSLAFSSFVHSNRIFPSWDVALNAYNTQLSGKSNNL